MRAQSGPCLGRLLGVLALLLALWCQALAPAVALQAAARTADPLLNPVICGHGTDGAALESPEPAPQGCTACPLCTVGLASPVLPVLAVIPRALSWATVAWPIPPPGTSKRRTCAGAEPRGPPATS